jgi:nitrogen fixation protein FixH
MTDILQIASTALFFAAAIWQGIEAKNCRSASKQYNRYIANAEKQSGVSFQ